MTLPGVGKVMTAMRAGPGARRPPKHRESDEVVHRGTITKQGSPLVRWAAIEAVGNYRAKGNEKLPPTTKASPSTPARTRLVSRWPASSCPLVYALRDGEVRCLEDRRLSLGHGPTRARLPPWPPILVWPSFLIEPVGTWPNPIMCGDRRMNGWRPTGACRTLDRSDGNSQHQHRRPHQDAPLAAGVNAKPPAGIARR